jgi:hypothetical protein
MMKKIVAFREYMKASKNVDQFWEQKLRIMLIKRGQKKVNQESRRAREIKQGRRKEITERKKERKKEGKKIV